MGGKSRSSVQNSQSTSSADNRLVVDSGIGVSAHSGSTVTVNNTTTDAQIVDRALDAVEINNATNAKGFTDLLDASESLFDRGERLIGMTQQSVAEAYQNAQTAKTGAIDQKTMIVLAIAGAATVFAMKRK
jgi:flagellar basal body rod protein FlgG